MGEVSPRPDPVVLSGIEWKAGEACVPRHLLLMLERMPPMGQQWREPGRSARDVTLADGRERDQRIDISGIMGKRCLRCAQIRKCPPVKFEQTRRARR